MTASRSDRSSWQFFSPVWLVRRTGYRVKGRMEFYDGTDATNRSKHGRWLLSAWISGKKWSAIRRDDPCNPDDSCGYLGWSRTWDSARLRYSKGERISSNLTGSWKRRPERERSLIIRGSRSRPSGERETSKKTGVRWMVRWSIVRRETVSHIIRPALFLVVKEGKGRRPGPFHRQETFASRAQSGYVHGHYFMPYLFHGTRSGLGD